MIDPTEIPDMMQRIVDYMNTIPFRGDDRQVVTRVALLSMLERGLDREDYAVFDKILSKCGYERCSVHQQVGYKSRHTTFDAFRRQFIR